MSSGDLTLLESHLRSARARAFVGREQELAAFRSALHDSGPSVLYVHGTGGIGKSALLRRFAEEATAAGRPVAMVDGRTLDPSPAAFEAEAGLVLRDARAVLLVDTFERCQGLEGWLRERFLPRVPVGALVVVAGRSPLDVRWQADPGWAEALAVIRLRDLAPVDAKALLAARGVAPALLEPLLAFAGGHPLALSLGAAVAIKDHQASDRWAPTQDVVTTLLEQLIGEVPSPAHRHALEVCAHAYTTTEDLLRAALREDAAPLFAWLRRLPFVESNDCGVFPHDVVREALEADLRWRDPQGYAAMHGRIHDHLATWVRTAAEPEVLPAVQALLHLHRHNGMSAGSPVSQGVGEIQEDPFQPADADALMRLAGQVDNEESAAWVAYWLARQPGGFRVYRRTETGEPVAFSAWLRLEESDEKDFAADPITAAAWAHARATAPPRTGEFVAVGRTWVLPDQQGDSPVMDLIHWRAVACCLRADRMAWSYLAVSGPESSSAYMRHHDMHDITVRPMLGDEPYALFAHDWRLVPAQAWLDRQNQLLMSGARELAPAPQPEAAVLTREEFGDAVRKALRGLNRPGTLTGSPLARSRLVERHPAPDPATALRELLVRTIESLREDPRAVKLHRALSTTFLRGVPTQEAAAERLGLPFTTYRRHLGAGIERVCEELWHRESYGAGR
jgi:hypothetical protein